MAANRNYDAQVMDILVTLQEKSIDVSSPTLGIKDLAFVRQAMVCVMTRWYDIGLQWGVDPDTLDKIKSIHRKNLDACFTDMIAEWLKSQPSLETSWKEVIAAIAGDASGRDSAAASRLADLIVENGVESLFCTPEADGVDDSEIGIDAMNEVVKALVPVAAKWHEIGVIMGLNHDELQALTRSDKDANECMTSVAKKWLKRKQGKKFGVPSWKKLVGAIGVRTGGGNGTHAADIARHHPAAGQSSEGVKRPHLEHSNGKLDTRQNGSSNGHGATANGNGITPPAGKSKPDLKGRVEQDGSPSRHSPPSITVPPATRSPAVPVGATAITVPPATSPAVPVGATAITVPPATSPTVPVGATAITVPPATSPTVPVGATATKFETDRRQLLNVDQNTAYSATELLGLTPDQLDGSDIKLAIIDLGFIPHPCLSPDIKVITDGNPPNPQRDPYHGTQVAAIAAGKSIAGHKVVNGVPTVFTYPGGIAPNVKLTLCQFNDTLDGLRIIFEKLKHDDNFNHVVFIPWGLPQEKVPTKRRTEFSLLVGELEMKGTIILAGSGNSGNAEENRFPSCLGNVISVGCHTNNAKTPAYSSDIGVDISCFGEVLAPCGPLQWTHDSSGKQLPLNPFIPFVGTSMATPVAAAVVCLGLQRAEHFGYLKAISRTDCILKMLKAMKNSKGALKPSKFLSKANEEQFANLL